MKESEKTEAFMKDILADFTIEKDLCPVQQKICKDFIEKDENKAIFEDIIHLVNDISYARIPDSSLYCIRDVTLYQAIYKIVLLAEKMRGSNDRAVESEFNQVWGEKRKRGWLDYERRVNRLHRALTSGIRRTRPRAGLTPLPYPAPAPVGCCRLETAL